MQIKKKHLNDYLERLYNEKIEIHKFEKLGVGCHGSGFLIEFCHNSKKERLVLKTLEAGIGLGHDHFSDRAQVLIWANDTFNKLPKHIKAIDVAGICKNKIISIGKAKEFFLLMDEAKGIDYFCDLEKMKNKNSLDTKDIAKIKQLADYLAHIHSVKYNRKNAKIIYWRKIRDTIGHGECLMGVFDTYPDDIKFTDYSEMAEIEKKCIDWRAKLKAMHHRTCQIHGDFHPGNIWFSDNDFTILDRSRGEYGDAADDVTAFTINYIFSSIIHHGELKGAYEEALRLFYEYYLKLMGDYEITKVSALFYAFRGVVVANPIFYPDITEKQRRKIFNFIHGILDADKFKIDEIKQYIND